MAEHGSLRGCRVCLLPLAVLFGLYSSRVAAQREQVITSRSAAVNATAQFVDRKDVLRPNTAFVYMLGAAAGNGPKHVDPDIVVKLIRTSATGNADLYCNPNWGPTSEKIGFPQLGFSTWQSTYVGMDDQVFISRNDRPYRPDGPREPGKKTDLTYSPSFLCSVINVDSPLSVSYRVEVDYIYANMSLNTLEQDALRKLYTACCSGSDSCLQWKNMSATTNTSIYTDFCSFQNQACTDDGDLLRLDLSDFNMVCPAPTDLFVEFESLTTLKLSGNRGMTGNVARLFDALAALEDLDTLEIYDTGLNGTLADSDDDWGNDGICKLTHESLTVISASGLQLTGTLPECLFEFNSNVTELLLAQNKLTGTLPRMSSQLSLEYITLANNSISGSIPVGISRATGLQTFDFQYNRLTGSIPPGLGSLPWLNSAVLSFNRLTGSIPSSLATSQQLTFLDVRDNNLTALPKEWYNTSFYNVSNPLSLLYYFRASYNQLEGPFPVGLASAPELIYLVLGVNKLSGPLPAIPKMFPKLRFLNVTYNNLSGPIPEEWGTSGIFKLPEIRNSNGHVFDLSFNKFTGTIPAFLRNDSVPAYAKNGTYIQGNPMSFNCGPDYAYLRACSNPESNSPALPSSPAAVPATLTPAVAPVGQLPVVGTGNQSPGSSSSSINSASADGQRSSGQSGNGQSKGLATGAVVGIAVGVLAAVLLVAGIVVGLIVRDKKRRTGRAVLSNKTSGFTKYADQA